MSLIALKLLVLSLSAMLEVLGLILMGYGIFSLNKTAENFSGGLFVIFGLAIMITAVFGFLAAIREAPISLLIYLGVLVLMIRTQVVLIGIVSSLKDEIKENIRKSSAFKSILVPDPASISELEILINWLMVLKIVCWLIIAAEGAGAVFAWLLFRRIRRTRLTENPIPCSVPVNIALTSCNAANS